MANKLVSLASILFEYCDRAHPNLPTPYYVTLTGDPADPLVSIGEVEEAQGYSFVCVGDTFEPVERELETGYRPENYA